MPGEIGVRSMLSDQSTHREEHMRAILVTFDGTIRSEIGSPELSGKVPATWWLQNAIPGLPAFR